MLVSHGPLARSLANAKPTPNPIYRSRPHRGKLKRRNATSMTAENASDPAANGAPANGEAKQNWTGSPVARRGGPPRPPGPRGRALGQTEGQRPRQRRLPASTATKTVDARPPLRRCPARLREERREMEARAILGEVVYVCQSYGFIRKDGDSSSEDIFMHLKDVDLSQN